jgi:phosphoribosyl-ATP pyrophosphohydrolase/phosphoribosyl-AMP cyclohydrolase
MKLTPAIVQDVNTGAVLMLAYMNDEALQKTIETRETWFWSRSRNELWHKGATSGNTQRVVHIAADCDDDAILISVEPNGPACHKGTTSCFEGVPAPPIPHLVETLKQRRETRPEGSYTAKLFNEGTRAIAQKVGEEATEVVVATLSGEGRARVVSEAADLVFHLLVLLVNEGIEWTEVEAELQRRSNASKR